MSYLGQRINTGGSNKNEETMTSITTYKHRRTHTHIERTFMFLLRYPI